MSATTVRDVSEAPGPDQALENVERWFALHRWTPFPFQREVWRAYLAGESGLVHAATGTGKTLAVWMGPLIEAMYEPRRTPALRVLWITPLRALAADTAEALVEPVHGLGLDWTVETRTSDTPSSIRARQGKRLPTTLLTTPESLALLLSRADSAALFDSL